jgi:hypothetical protein
MIKKNKSIIKTEVIKKNKLAKSKQNFVFKENSIKTKGSKAILYNKYIKSIIKEIPDLLTNFSKFSRSNEYRYVDPKGRFEIINVINQIKGRGATANEYDIISKGNKAQVLIIKKPIKTTFFIKQNNSLPKEVIIGETLVINLLKKRGIKTIDSHLAYKSKNNISSKEKSFVVYDFTNKLTVKDAIQLNKFTQIELNLINTKMKNIIKNIETSKIPINNYRNKDHYFIDLKTKELYFFDPLVLPNNFAEIYNIAKKQLKLI